MAPPRTWWKGHLRLSLVSIAVDMYPAVASSVRPSLHQIHRPSGRRIRYQKTVPGIGPVENADIARGVAVGDDTYVIIEPEELDAIRLESRHTLDLVQFVGEDEIDPRYFERPFYLAPGSDISTEGFAVIRTALKRERKMGLGQLALRGQEYLVALRHCGAGMLVETLRYAAELRDSTPIFRDIPAADVLDEEMVSLAQRLITDRSEPFDPGRFHDTYADALQTLVEARRSAHHLIQTPSTEEPETAEVVDLMEALRKSVAERRRASAESKPKKEGNGRPGGRSGRQTG